MMACRGQEHIYCILRQGCLPFCCVVLMVALSQTMLSQSSPADGPWSGQIQCQLDVQQQGYVRHETQTWTLTSSTPTSKNGAMQIYPAVWTATGQGAVQRAQGARSSTAQWTINAPPAKGSLAMFVRASDGQFIIRVWQRQATLYNAVTGTRQIAVDGVAKQPGPISYAVNEWPLPWIETTPCRPRVSAPSSPKLDHQRQPRARGNFPDQIRTT